MNRRYALLVFIVIVLALCVAAYLIGRALLPGSPAEPGPRSVWTPPALTAMAGPSQPSVARTDTSAPATTRTPTPTAPRISTPIGTASASPTPIGPATPTETPTLTPTATMPATYRFQLAQAVRHSSGDCPGIYILGKVTDRQGRPLADVRLKLTDEYGNTDVKTTKSAAGDLGRYDFPIFGPARRFYLSIIDAQGRPLSPTVEIPHGLDPAPQATCHHVDWQER